VKRERAIVVLMSVQGQAVRDITSLMQVSADYVRDVIHAFNERGSTRWTQMDTVGEYGAVTMSRHDQHGHVGHVCWWR
jgi:transposase